MSRYKKLNTIVYQGKKMYESVDSEFINITSIDDLNIYSLWVNINELWSKHLGNPYKLSDILHNAKDLWYLIELSNPEYDDIFEIIEQGYDEFEIKNKMMAKSGVKYIRIVTLDQVTNSLLLNQGAILDSSKLLGRSGKDDLYAKLVQNM